MCETGLMGNGTPHLSEDGSSQGSGPRGQAAPTPKQGVSGLASTPRHGDHNMHVLIPCLQGLPRTWRCVCQVSVSSISEHA